MIPLDDHTFFTENLSIAACKICLLRGVRSSVSMSPVPFRFFFNLNTSMRHECLAKVTITGRGRGAGEPCGTSNFPTRRARTMLEVSIGIEGLTFRLMTSTTAFSNSSSRSCGFMLVVTSSGRPRKQTFSARLFCRSLSIDSVNCSKTDSAQTSTVLSTRADRLLRTIVSKEVRTCSFGLSPKVLENLVMMSFRKGSKSIFDRMLDVSNAESEGKEDLPVL